MNITRFLLILFCVLLFGYQAANAQSQCPENMVCITRDAALKALADADRVKALESEIAAKDKAYADLKDVLAEMKTEFARCSGESTILKQRAVSDAAMIELLSKMVRPKKIGLINF